MLPVFLVATFSAATLLFLVQPMVARQLLPTLGGSPAIWNVCMVFFQVVLVMGYGYANLLTRWIPRPKTQVVVHAVVLLTAVITLPIGVPADLAPTSGEAPAMWVLSTLVRSVGVPFFALSSAGPLLQHWFSRTDHRWAADPYFLYAASNFGSMVALAGFPLLVEPNLVVSSQLVNWSIGFGGFGALALVCGSLAAKRSAVEETLSTPRSTPPASGDSVTIYSRLRWMFFAFVPSSLMLGVTQHLSTDVSPTPLLWVVPLGIYLLTYLIAFTSWGRWVTRGAAELLPAAVLAVAVLGMLHLRSFMVERSLIHLGALFIIGLACHGRLADQRPAASRLTEFYLFISIGGALGGMFNALAAPLLFTWVAEYPIVLVLACLVRRPQRWRNITGGSWEVPSPSDLVGLAFILWFLLGGRLGLSTSQFALPLMLAGTCLLVASSYWRFTVGVVILLAYPRIVDVEPDLYRSRSFFGTYQVYEREDGSGHWHHLYHGTTLHGSQYSQDPWASQPTVYYTLDGPIGDLVAALKKRPGPIHLGCVGLGCGTLAHIGEPGWKITFYEIDPEIKRIATNPKLFTNIEKSKADIDFKIGDARLEMAKLEDRYDLIILDAFSSDAVPVHLITKEAVQLYLEHLKPGGILAFHVTNRYLDLPPVLANIAEELGVVAVSRRDSSIPETERIERKKESTYYVAIAKTEPELGTPSEDTVWTRLFANPGQRVWTDDYSNIWAIRK